MSEVQPWLCQHTFVNQMGIKACKPIIDPGEVEALMDDETRSVLKARFTEIARGGESFTADELAAYVRSQGDSFDMLAML